MIRARGRGPALIATRPAYSAAKVLKVVLAVDMRGIDPVFNTGAYAAYHGYLVYDQLFALDSDGKPQPQMVDSWQVSDNRKAWMFRLRSGLKFHDGSPVRAADAIASILRWKDRDVVGKALFSAGAKLEVVDVSPSPWRCAIRSAWCWTRSPSRSPTRCSSCPRRSPRRRRRRRSRAPSAPGPSSS